MEKARVISEDGKSFINSVFVGKVKVDERGQTIGGLFNQKIFWGKTRFYIL